MNSALDSMASQREIDAILEFQNHENAQFHIMRDHRQHGAPILGKSFSIVISLIFNFDIITLKLECGEQNRGKTLNLPKLS